MMPDTTLTALDAAFPASVKKLMPAFDEIPEEFRRGRNTKWHQLQADAFFKGLKGVKATPKPGVDVAAALRHLNCINGSYEPKHEHKVAAFAYLASLWFEDISYEVPG